MHLSDETASYLGPCSSRSAEGTQSLQGASNENKIAISVFIRLKEPEHVQGNDRKKHLAGTTSSLTSKPQLTLEKQHCSY